MAKIHAFTNLIVLFISISILSACAPVSNQSPQDGSLSYRGGSLEEPLHQHSPVFIIEKPEHDYNRIATPVPVLNGKDKPTISMDTESATVFAEERVWEGNSGNYTNLIYRIHFSEIPFRLWPLHLGAGKNIGLFVIITINDNNQPLLITTLHTCGCYLSFTPTSYLDPKYFPDNWSIDRQYIYGEDLPAFLKFQNNQSSEKITLLLRESTHRVKNIFIGDETPPTLLKNKFTISPLSDLTQLLTSTGETFSFYETDGSRKEYVIDSQKILERLFISWWAFDWRVGEDKRLGRNTSDGVVFYTSLKPWARKTSDLRDFSSFLTYWGWKL